MAKQRFILDARTLGRTRFVQGALGVSYAEMEGDLHEAMQNELRNRPDLLDLSPGEADLLLNNVQHRRIDSGAIPSRVVSKTKLGSRVVVDSGGFFDAKEVIEATIETRRYLESIVPRRTGAALTGIEYVSGRASGTLGTTNLRIARGLSEADLADELGSVGVASTVDYASVLEVRGWSSVTPVKRAYFRARRMYRTRMAVVLRYIPTDQLGRGNYPDAHGFKGPPDRGGRGAYNAAVIVFARLGVEIAQTRKTRYRRVRPDKDVSRGHSIIRQILKSHGWRRRKT